MFVRNLMVDDTTTLSPDTILSDALMALEAKPYATLPVTEEDRRLAGILSQTDVWRAVRQRGDVGAAMKLRVSDVMTRTVQSVSPDDPVENVAGIISRARHSILPVIEGGVLIGVISASDIARGFAEMMGQGAAGTTRLTLLVPDQVGQLAGITRIIAGMGINITHVSTYPSRTRPEYLMVVRVSAADPAALVQALQQEGYAVLHVN